MHVYVVHDAITISFAAMAWVAIFIVSAWFSDGLACWNWWAETLKDAIIPGILAIMAAYITAHGIPDGKAHVCEEYTL